LLEPVANPGRDAVWSVGGSVRGQAAQWLARVRPFLPGVPVDGSGSMRLEFTSRVSPQSWDVRQLVFHSEPLRFRSPRVNVDEQTVHVELDGRWDFGLHQGSIPNALFQSSALALRATDVGWNMEATQPRLTGDVSFRADLTRLQASWQVPSPQQNWRVAGAVQGQVSLVQHEGSTQARWSIDLVGAELARRTGTTTPDMLNVIPAANSTTWRTVWKEPVLKLVGSGQYDGSREVAQLDRFDVTAADDLKLSTEGSITQPFSECDVDLKGRVTYDLAQLAERILPQSRLRMAGQDTQSFWLRGPLFHPPQSPVREVAAVDSAPRGLLPQALSGLGGLRWQSADVFGIAVGPGLVSAKLTAGTIETNVVEMPVSGGTLRMVPRVYLNSEPPLLTVDAGQILTDVSITPGMCQGWLKYVTPLAADATRAEGKFSLSLERAAISLEQPATSQLQGILLVDSARIGPGPLAMQFIDLGEQIKAIVQGRLPAGATQEPITWVLIPQQRTRFQVVDGRAHHDQFEFRIGDTVLRTRGSVGLDESLALVAHIPIQDEWLARDPRLAALQGMTVEVPISGTLSRPRLDTRALEQLASQVLRQSANRLLEEGVNRGLQQLLGPKR
jgi:translocation and assembly module TamB